LRRPNSDCLRVGLSGAVFPEGAREFLFTRIHPDWSWGPPSFLLNGYWRSPRASSGRSVALTTHLHIAPTLIQNTAIPLHKVCTFILGYEF